ncbi:hypothetical protein N9092_03665 [Akkermansiaceae bacterium]|nr:hypothetical protein [Akkermansiaceae bacterium]
MGGRTTGFGHIARMIPIYDAFVEAGQSAEFFIDGDAAVFGILEDRKAALKEWQHEDLSLQDDDIVLIDTLEAPRRDIGRIYKQTKHVYFISDHNKTGGWPFKVINWQVGSAGLKAENGLYGEKYVPLRKEALYSAAKGKAHSSEPKVLISMGGGDVLNLVPKTIALLKEFRPEAKIVGVIRSFHPQYQDLMAQQDERLEILADVSAVDLFQAMEDCTLAVASGGHSIYEFALMGIPVIHVRIAENQDPAKCWDDTGFTFPVGLYEAESYPEKVKEGLEYFDKEQREEASSIGRSLIDGKGGQRICSTLIKLLDE